MTFSRTIRELNLDNGDFRKPELRFRVGFKEASGCIDQT